MSEESAIDKKADDPKDNNKWANWLKKQPTILLVILIFIGVGGGLGIIWGLCLVYVPLEKDRVQIFLAIAVNYLILLAMFGQAYITQRQARLMQNQKEIMDRQLDLTQELERAFISLQQIVPIKRPHWPRPGKFFYTFHLYLVNSGRTPAKEVLLEINYEFRDSPLPEDFDFPYVNEPRTFTIHPQGIVNWPGGQLLDIQLLEIQDRAKYFFVWCRLRYRDIFTGTPVYTFQFCRQIGDVMGVPTSSDGPVEIPFTFYGNYDYAD